MVVVRSKGKVPTRPHRIELEWIAQLGEKKNNAWWELKGGKIIYVVREDFRELIKKVAHGKNLLPNKFFPPKKLKFRILLLKLLPWL